MRALVLISEGSSVRPSSVWMKRLPNRPKKRMIASRRGNASPGARSHIRAERDQTMFLTCLSFAYCLSCRSLIVHRSLESPKNTLIKKANIQGRNVRFYAYAIDWMVTENQSESNNIRGTSLPFCPILCKNESCLTPRRHLAQYDENGFKYLTDRESEALQRLPTPQLWLPSIEIKINKQKAKFMK